MTERLTLEEARRKGYLRAVQPGEKPAPLDTGAGSAEAKALRRHLAHRDGLLLFLKKLLELGFDVRLEYRFHHSRRWRFDVALLDLELAVEIDGGGWIHGRHHRAAGRTNDNEKDAAAQLDGWRVIHVSPEHIANGEALALVERYANGTE